MNQKHKTFFLLFLPFLIVPSFFFFFPSSQPSFAIPSSKVSRVYESDHWKDEDQRIKALTNIKYIDRDVFIPILLGSKEFSLQDKEGKNTVYYFDKIIFALREQMQKQKKDIRNITFLYIKGEAKKQLLQFHIQSEDTTEWNSTLIEHMNQKRIVHATSFFNSLKPWFLKMKVFNISSFFPLWDKTQDFALSNFLLIDSVSIKDPKSASYYEYDEWDTHERDQLHMLIAESLDSLDHTQIAIQKVINHVASPWLRVLQKARGLNLSFLAVGSSQVDVSSLVASQVKEASTLSLADLEIIKKLQTIILNFPKVTSKNLQTTGLKKLESALQFWVDAKLNSYKTSIQSTLEGFANTKIKKIVIKGTPYQVDLLFQDANSQSASSQLSSGVKDQLLSLLRAKITPEILKYSLLEAYHLTIVNNLNALQEQNISEFQINGKTYFLTELTKLINKNKVFPLLTAKAKTELTTLAKNAITKTQLDTVLIKFLEIEATNLQTEKNKKKLMIGLSVAGGIIGFPTLVWFCYWLFKARK